MIRFIGSKEYRMDDKGRVALLPQWRKLLPNSVFLTIGLNNSIWGFSPEGWERLTEKLDENPLPSDSNIKMAMALASDAFETEIDKQGRVMVPQQWRDQLKLGEEIVVAGLIGHFEIRDRAGWEEVRASARADVNAMRQRQEAAQK
jgi:MraZ protein